MLRNLLIGIIIISSIPWIVGITIPAPLIVENSNISVIDHNSINLDLDTTYVKSDIATIKEIAVNVSNSHEYLLGVFDCEDYSKELVIRLRELNFNATCEAGYTNYNISMPHEWVRIDYNGEIIRIESVYGIILTDEYFTEHYQIMREDFCL